MCSTGGGNSFFESVVDVVLQNATFGAAGFKSDEGGVGAGITGKPAINLVKEVTGANAAEEANEDARARFESEKDQALQDRSNAQAQNAANQLQASRSAGAVRSGSVPKTNRSSNLGSDERDFLGL